MPIRSGLPLVLALAGLAFVLGGTSQASAQVARPMVTQRIDERQLVTLAGNTRPEAIAQNDRGRVADTRALDHMQLLLKRPAELEAALDGFIETLHNPASPNFHNWMTNDQFDAQFAPAAADVRAVTKWLTAAGFQIETIHGNGLLIDFSGTAGQVRAAFHTEIHALDVGGVAHIANVSDPQIPAALSPVVAGIVSLHDFRPHRMYKPRTDFTFTSGGRQFEALVPADLTTIYNLGPLFSAGISGQGQTIVVIEDTNVFSTSDWTTFRSTFGLSSFTGGSFTQVHPAPRTGRNNCTNPGVNGDDGEAILDAEWASAAAPSAAIELASCADTSTTFGGLIALQNLIAAATTPAIVSISYGECEAENGATMNAAFNTAYQQAVALGISIFVSSGDEGAASCDANQAKATHGIGVSGFASTPFNVAVGGTDYGDTFAGTVGTYWNATNGTTLGSAKSYIPEIPWNDSCASLLLTMSHGSTVPYGTSGFCNSTTGKASFLSTASGSGGPSGCATGRPSTTGIVGGTCAGYAKPSWQAGIVGIPSDGVRDIPDVSLFAANGVWGHYYVFCYSDPSGEGSAPCTGSPSGWSGAGGTSFSSPILAAIQALVNQHVGARQGNPNPVYYALAATEYGAGGSTTCNSSLGNGVAASCIFYDVIQGDMDVNCTGTHNCYLPSGTNGVLSTSNTAYQPAYKTGTGWDFATGIGTVNAANLVNNWSTATAAARLASRISR
ncbi:MAG TPA: S53 family peptidase [Aliidongia sp.]|nr:S53 family peptidase [Aliidongia sp.]